MEGCVLDSEFLVSLGLFLSLSSLEDSEQASCVGGVFLVLVSETGGECTSDDE